MWLIRVFALAMLSRLEIILAERRNIAGQIDTFILMRELNCEVKAGNHY